jgi:hypothetical protein
MERRFMACPKALNFTPGQLAMRRLQQGFAIDGMGFRGQVARQQYGATVVSLSCSEITMSALAAAVRASYEIEAAEKAKQLEGQVVRQVPAE